MDNRKEITEEIVSILPIPVVVSCSTCLYTDSLQSEDELKCWHCKNYNKHEPK